MHLFSLSCFLKAVRPFRLSPPTAFWDIVTLVVYHLPVPISADAKYHTMLVT